VSIRRIIVVQESTRAADVLDAVAEAAAALQAELLGLFLEDVELLRFAGLPFAREVGASAMSRGLDVPTMERRLRSQAVAARRSLAAAAEGKPVQWAFRVERGSVEIQLRKALASADLVVLTGARGEGAPARSAALLSAVELSSTVAPALEHLARALAGSVYLVQVGEGEGAPRSLEGEALSPTAQDSWTRLVVGEQALARLLRELWRGGVVAITPARSRDA